MFDNKDLKKQIEDMRKERLGFTALLDGLKSQNDNLENRIVETRHNNEEAFKSKF